ncbi:hypothetical protein BH20ACI3_BH20ACI3_10650 [soil metagenome]
MQLSLRVTALPIAPSEPHIRWFGAFRRRQPHFLLRDRDQIYGGLFGCRMRKWNLRGIHRSAVPLAMLQHEPMAVAAAFRVSENTYPADWSGEDVHTLQS